MTKEKLWEAYVAKNPSFLTDGAQFTASGLKKFFDQTFDKGHDKGFENGKAWEKLHPTKQEKSTKDKLMEIFEKKGFV